MRHSDKHASIAADGKSFAVPAGPNDMTRRRISWLPLGGGLLALLCLIALIQLVFVNRPKAENPLEGDSEVATGALADLLNKTPVDQRLPLLHKEMQDPNPGLRYAATDALGDLHNPAVAADLEHAFADSASTVRQRAMEALPHVDQERGLRLLLAGMHDEDTWIREAAIGQLGLYVRNRPAEAHRAIPTLIAALDDPGDVLPISAMNLLHKVTGQPWTVKTATPRAQRQAAIQHWKDWWEQERPRAALPAEFLNVSPIRPTRTDPAPDFHLTDIDGRSLSLQEQRGKVTLLNFWGTWCPPCQLELPDLARLDRSYRSRGLDIVGIALSEHEGGEGLRRWCKAHGLDYRQTLSTDAVQDAFGHIEEVPVSVLIDRHGRIRYRWEGERDLSTFGSAVERLLQERP